MSGTSEPGFWGLRSSFGSVAGAYERHRPDYAPPAVSWALRAAPGRRVLDLGAGTRKLTRTVEALGFEVTAVEPDPAMLAELRRTSPQVRAYQGSAEQIPLPDGSVDAVVAGNAMHWFEMERAAPELARVLSPGGVVAGLWNLMDDRVDWVARLAEAGGPEAIGPRDTPAAWGREASRIHEQIVAVDAGFGSAEQALFPHGQPRTAESLVATFATKAGLLVMSPRQREDRMSSIRDFLRSREETSRGGFTLPLVTGVLLVRLRPGRAGS